MNKWRSGRGRGGEENSQQIMSIKYYQFKSSARVLRKYMKTATKFSLKIHIFWDILMYW